ncbi:ABC transporter permease [Brevundimonas pishanensis]|uniref:ABC transporter permease n=1 Tax=Brevundimonas pishanensis TaxID=2896315 RepID=UPI003D036A02
MPQVQSQGANRLGTRRSRLRSFCRAPVELGRTLYALIMREMMTRYGREGIGFFWLIAEPLAFCLGVIILWSAIKPEYEHGIRVAPFTMSGYMCLLLLRHLVTHSLHALQANTGLLFHRKVQPLHIYLARAILEILGSTLAFFIVYALLLALGQVDMPKDWILLYSGWFILAWVSFGFAMVMAALSIRYEAVERLNNLTLYIMIPLSGAFVMAEYVPASYREYFLYIPFPHAIEMVRAGIWGEFIPTHYTAWYPIAFGGVLMLLGLIMLKIYGNYIETE